MAKVFITDYLLLHDLRDNREVFLGLLQKENKPLLERLKAAIQEIDNQCANMPVSKKDL
jgi:hypothetical protein